MGYLSDILSHHRERNEPKRNYIGASGIGGLCSRAIWYGYHSDIIPQFTAQQLRTFEIGKKLESVIIDELIACGLDIVVEWPALQDKEFTLLQGHVDAVWRDIAIIEVKTARDASFRIFQKKGLRNWYPIYYSQVQAYMGMSGYNKAYVIAVNKDTSEVHDECISYDEGFYVSLREKAKRLAEMAEAPNRINESPMYFVCKMCAYKGECHKVSETY